MAFRIVEKLPAVEWPVKIPVPQNGGTVEPHEISVTFQQLSDKELQGKYKTQTKREFLLEVITNWSGVENEDGSPVPFSAEKLEKVLGVSYARDAIFEAYQSMILGIAEKN